MVFVAIVQAALPPTERSGRRKASRTARTHKMRKSTITVPRTIRMNIAKGLYAADRYFAAAGVLAGCFFLNTSCFAAV